VGRGVVLDEAVNEHLPQAYNAAVEEHQVKPLGQPDVDVTAFADGGELTFTAEVDVRPDIELPTTTASRSRSPTPRSPTPTSTSSSRACAGGSARCPVERPVRTGDFVTLDLAATVDGEPIDDATASGLSYEVGSGQLLDGVDDAVVGLSSGEEATFARRSRAASTRTRSPRSRPG
jgi:trigger factor